MVFEAPTVCSEATFWPHFCLNIHQYGIGFLEGRRGACGIHAPGDCHFVSYSRFGVLATAALVHLDGLGMVISAVGLMLDVKAR